MTAGLSAMNGLYGMNNFQNYYNNPYFLQAFNSPNYNQYMQAQQGNVQQNFNNVPQTNGQNGTQLPNGANINFQGAQNAIANQAKEEKSGNGLAWALGIAATAIGTAWWLASRGKARNANGLWNQIKLGATSLFNKPTIIKGADIAKHKSSLNINEALKWTDEATDLRRFQFELKDANGTLQKIFVKNGEVTNKAYNEGKFSETFKKQIDDIIKTIKEKDLSKIPEGVNLKNIQYTAKLNNGIGVYNAITPDAVDNFKFAQAYLKKL